MVFDESSIKKYEEGEKYRKEIIETFKIFVDVLDKQANLLEMYRETASFFFLHDSSSGTFKNTYRAEKRIRNLQNFINKDILGK